MVDHAIATLDEDDSWVNLAQSVWDIAQDPYWTRVWVIQEFLLARKIHIYYGDSQVDEAIFRTVLLEQIGLHAGTAKSTVLLDRRDPLLEEWPPLIFVSERQLNTRSQMKRPLYDLLAGHADAECSDPSDMIFALLSLVEHEERMMLNRYFPDYAISFVVVALVALAHLRYFAGDKPLQPLLRALKLETELTNDDELLLFHFLPLFDYVGSTDSAADKRNLEIRLGHEDELERRIALKNARKDDYTHKLEQPGMTLDVLYDSSSGSKTTEALQS